jgi:F-type H+-transporting ATPase subunit delta
VNPDLIGGFVVEFGDRLYDASIAHQLDGLRKTFIDGSYEKKI